MFKHTKIVATLGPACQSKTTLKEMVSAGMDAARLNFSHGTHEDHQKFFQWAREIEKESRRPIAILQDLQGPKIRIGIVPEGGVLLKDGQIATFTAAKANYASDEIPVDFAELPKFVSVGERLLVNDGRVETKIIKKEDQRIHVEVIEGGRIVSNSGINVPDTAVNISPLTEKDKADLRAGVQWGVDFVAVSFVNTARDILDIRYLIKQFEEELGVSPAEPPIRVIAKIERQEAVRNIKEILEVADGIMIARGDLGIEERAAEVPLIQKRLVDEANALSKPVIVATQMLDSMREYRRPTRAEVSDVANAVIDHADALMLSNETAVGEHPVLAIQTMADIIRTTERSSYDDLVKPLRHKKGSSIDIAITELSRALAEEVKAKIILAASISGETGRLISHIRPNLPVLVATNSERVLRQLNLSWGVRPFILPQSRTIEELVERSVLYIKENKIAKEGDRMIVVAGEPVGQAGHVNLVEVKEII